jgi:hypothetical protein
MVEARKHLKQGHYFRDYDRAERWYTFTPMRDNRSHFKHILIWIELARYKMSVVKDRNNISSIDPSSNIGIFMRELNEAMPRLNEQLNQIIADHKKGGVDENYF